MVLMMRFLAAIIVWLIVVLAAVGSIGLYTRVFPHSMHANDGTSVLMCYFFMVCTS